MALVYGFTPRFWKELAQVRSASSPQERALLFNALREVVRSPTLRGRLSFHDPKDPKARCYLVPPFTILYTTTDAGTALFTSVFRSGP